MSSARVRTCRDPATGRVEPGSVGGADRCQSSLAGQSSSRAPITAVCSVYRPTRWDPTVDAQAAFADDCRAAGLELAGD